MSLPRQAPTHAASSSSSPPPSTNDPSLRRPGSGASLRSPPPTQPRGLLPSPHFADDPTSTANPTDSGVEYSEHAVGDGDGDHESYNQDHGTDHEHDHDHDDAHAPPLPDSFQPFFTLVQDTVTNQHFHPTVHYIFADDDSDLISEAACRSLEILDPSQQLPPSKSGQSVLHGHGSDNGLDEHEHGHLSPRLPPASPGVREHYLILDVQPRSAPPPGILPQQQSLLQMHTQASQQSQSIQPSSSPAPTSIPAPAPFTIVKATSLSAEWQVLRTKITTAPTIGDDDQDDGLMLMIQGRGNTPATLSTPGISGGNPADKAKEREADKDRESMEDLIEQFQRRMDETKQILDAVDGGTDE
ncbi:hypothetical protein PV10_02443 [Exophiala mesophila]|uniref:Anaphase-promoting complex subunit 11 RING-H2 finger domain-containing protein n=1 Tax=Exophiala mesophila TaxID=212818 RepID=A0A0D1ZL83_EXOME|nr:uncharacterized protein PV10_02443 [Exophiala mesophila]KIV94704.1 hypothetical protein PV10_02443 [Exophiala mesophila]